jgi:23S rRNA (cytosine1962-C5)-methyltransferase
MQPQINLLTSPNWTDYELLDSGDGQKLERFGPYTFVRPEVQALWNKSLPANQWQAADAVFRSSSEESGGHWQYEKKIPDRWEMGYRLNCVNETKRTELHFSVMTTPGRHLGVFPECAVNWDWLANTVLRRGQSGAPGGKPTQVLNLFGYTGLATLAAAASGAKVTHVDASK